MTYRSIHKPVLLKEVLNFLDPEPGNFIADGTFGEGGHTVELLRRIAPKGMILGTEINEETFARGGRRISEAAQKLAMPEKRLILEKKSYSDIPKIIKKKNLPGLDGLLLDLGLSSLELEESERGFSFKRNEPLDMRYNLEMDMTAAEIINGFDARELAKIFLKFGEEKWSRKIAKAIVEKRKEKKIIFTFDLVDLIKRSVPDKGSDKVITRIFQAIRIFVNKELDKLDEITDALPKIIRQGGRVAIISFHSLEDRIVKNKFRDLKSSGLAELITKKPVTPSQEELKENPRSRSAKLRVIEFK